MNSATSYDALVAKAKSINPVGMLLVVVGGVAAAEGLFELILLWRPTMSPYIEAVLDSGFLVAVALPLVYIRVYRPMHQLIDQYCSALNEVKTLRGIITICSVCKKIRTGRQSWEMVEAYVRAHSEAEFSHGLCPECVRKHYPEDADWIMEQISEHGPHSEEAPAKGAERDGK